MELAPAFARLSLSAAGASSTRSYAGANHLFRKPPQPRTCPGTAWQHRRKMLFTSVQMPQLFKEFLTLLRREKKWWLIPLVVLFLIVAALMLLSGGSVLAPLMYPSK